MSIGGFNLLKAIGEESSSAQEREIHAKSERDGRKGAVDRKSSSQNVKSMSLSQFYWV